MERLNLAHSCLLRVFVRAAVAGASLGVVSSAFAAEADSQIEEIIVTGSYISGTPQDAPSPVQVLSREELVISGVSDMSEAIRNLEIASGSDTSPQNGARFNGRSGSGLANVNLRGLGPTSTLVLLDGKRLPYAGQKLSNGDRFVDINSIPITMVQRIEVLKDGGSALYGSDAIAGVVNFITRRHFEGFELTGKFSKTTGEDQEDRTLGAIWGWASDNGRTHLVIGGEYFDRTEMESSERRDLRGSELFAKQDATIVNRSSAFGATLGGDPQCELLGFFRDNFVQTDPDACNRHRVETDLMIPKQGRESVMIVGSHAFSDSAEVYTQLSYAHTESGSNRPVHVGPIEPKFFFPTLLGATSAGFFPSPVPWSTNPFTGGAPGDPSVIANGGPLPIIPITAGLPLDLADFALRTPGLEPDRSFDSHADQVTTRYQLGLRGDFDIGARPWRYDLSVTRGDSRYETNFLGIDKDRLELAMYGLGGPNCVPNGSIAFGDPRADTARFLLSGLDGRITLPENGPQGLLEGLMTAVMGNVAGFPFINADNLVLAMTSDNQGTGGCQFYNPYLTRADDDPLSGPALTNSEELLRWLEVPMHDAQQSETFLTSVDFVLAGELFDLRDRPVSMAVGVQYREEGRATAVNPQTIGSVNSFGQLSGAETVAGLSENLNFDAERDVYAAFVEFQIPVLEDVDMQVAARYEDYGGGIGDTFDPKIGLRWQTTDSLVLRGSWSSSFRGPSLAQIEEGTGFSLELGVRDLLGERGDAIGLANGANCARTGQCALPSENQAPSIIIVKQGLPSPNLAPEQAETFNVGMIFSPLDGFFEGFTFGLDYYLIEFEDKIIDVPTQTFLTTELAAFQAARAAGDFTIVDPTAADFGQPCDPTAAEFQFASSGTRAEECQVNPAAYAFGSITRRADLSRDLQIIEGQAINTGRVETDGIDLNWSWVWGLDLGTIALSGNFNWIHKFEVADFPVGLPDFDAAGFTNRDPEKRLARSMPDLKGHVGLSWFRDVHQANVTMRYIGAYTDNAVPSLRLEEEFDPYYAFDVRYTYTYRLDRSSIDFTIGALDLFDADLPNVKDGAGVDLSVFDQRGRRWYASFTYRL